jgi:hypothetical protein
LEWFGGLYVNDGVIVQPTSKVRKCMINTAKISKMGRMVERAVSFRALFVPLVYDGPADPLKVFEHEEFHSRLSVGVGNKRVMRVRPKFFPWAVRVTGIFVEDAGLNIEDMERILDLAGVVEGLGDGRNIGYGRFVGKLVRS